MVRRLLRYRYRGTDPNHRDNTGLRELIQRREPLIYFHALVKGKYLAVWPVFVVGDEPTSLTFSVAVDDAVALKVGVDSSTTAEDVVADIRRGYITANTRRRIHQAAFRERVINAYRKHNVPCAASSMTNYLTLRISFQTPIRKASRLCQMVLHYANCIMRPSIAFLSLGPTGLHDRDPS